MNGALAALAEDPELFVEPPEGARHIVDERYCVVIGPDHRWASVCRLRLTDRETDVVRAVSEIRGLLGDISPVTWNIGSTATPTDLPERLRRLGLGDPPPPLDPVCTAMVLTDEPPTVDGIDVHRISSLEEHRVGLEIVLSAATWSDRAAGEARAAAEDTYERRTRRGGFQWLARHRGDAVAFGLADRTPAGLFLAGGATLPHARGRGAYRAVVRARWDEAVRLGTPGLAVQAQHRTSAPILRRLGFHDVATVRTLQSSSD